MNLTEKVAYLKGVMEGMEFDDSSKEGKLIKIMADIIEDMAYTVCELEEDTDTLNDYIEEIDEDLGALEEDYYGDCDCCDCDDDCDCDDECDCCNCDDDCDCDDDCEDETNFFETTCPSCGEQVYLDESIDFSRVICPACHATFSAKTEN